MILNQETGGIQLPAQSVAERIPPLSSRGHASGHLMVGDGEKRRVLLVESNLELKWALILDADPDVEEIKEQVRFDWPEGQRLRTHYFDFVVQMRSGQRAALIVKPAKRAQTDKFLNETRKIAEHVARTGFADETRVLTDEDVDPVQLRNARLFLSVREEDEQADSAAQSLAQNLFGAVPISELVSQLNLRARGFRALARLIAAGQLECLHHETISPSTLVKRGMSQ